MIELHQGEDGPNVVHSFYGSSSGPRGRRLFRPRVPPEVLASSEVNSGSRGSGKEGNGIEGDGGTTTTGRKRVTRVASMKGRSTGYVDGEKGPPSKRLRLSESSASVKLNKDTLRTGLRGSRTRRMGGESKWVEDGNGESGAKEDNLAVDNHGDILSVHTKPTSTSTFTAVMENCTRKTRVISSKSSPATTQSVSSRATSISAAECSNDAPPAVQEKSPIVAIPDPSPPTLSLKTPTKPRPVRTSSPSLTEMTATSPTKIVQASPTPEPTPSRRSSRLARCRNSPGSLIGVVIPKFDLSSKKRRRQQTIEDDDPFADSAAVPSSSQRQLPTPSSTPSKRPRAVSEATEERETADEREEEGVTELLITPKSSPQTPQHDDARRFKSRIVLPFLRQILSKISVTSHVSLPPSPLDQPHSSIHTFPYLPSLSTYERDLRSTLDRTVTEGEGNCLLIVGARGAGKTAMVNRTLSLLASVHESSSFITVRLNALVQSSDKLALREIARQLCKAEGGVEDDGSSFTSTANILSSLLALLEPPKNDLTIDPNSSDFERPKPLIFILDEFDLFALQDARQSFLYTLLDIVQGGKRKGGMAVIGLSARTDCINSLEKRVKSRCQSRVHHILPSESFDDFVATIKATVLADPLQKGSEEGDEEYDEREALRGEWNANVEACFLDPRVRSSLERRWNLNRQDVFGATRQMVELISALYSRATREEDIAVPFLEPRQLLHSKPEDPIKSLSIVELAVLIAVMHLTDNDKAFNMAMAYDLYSQHVKRSSASGQMTKTFSRPIFAKAFERLRTLELIRDALPTGRSTANRNFGVFKMCRLVPWPMNVIDEVKKRRDVPQVMTKWAVNTWVE